jgi:hypothetical protein
VISSPSPCTQGEGWGEGAFPFHSAIGNDEEPSPHPSL